jgi:ATP-dependent DNA helicase RecG
VITPRVEEGEKDLASVEAVFEQLANGPLEAFRVDVIHGRMSPAEKEAAMDAFRGQDTQVLVATSVIEVGVNVPNATVMTIESGESFGLAQLHQLRGRVRRGKFPGYVAVFASPGNAEAVQRLEAFARSTDGFELAEIDFSLRGPGDLLGIRQHGMPPLRIADLQRDYGILAEARRDAALLLEDAGLLQGLRPGQDQTMLPSEPDPRGAESNPGPPPRFFRPEFARLRRQVLQRYGKVLDLADVG